MGTVKILSCFVAALLIGGAMPAVASTAMAVSPHDEGGVLTLDLASKGKIIRLPNGDLVSAYAYGNSESNFIYDVKTQKEQPAQDIFIRVSKDEGTT